MDLTTQRWHERFGKGVNDVSPEKMWNTKYQNYFEEKKLSKIVDLGCGDGVHACFMLEQGYDVEGCDISEAALEVVRQRNPNLPLKHMDMNQGLPFPPNSVGIFFASLSVHYFSMADTITLFGNIYNALEPGGYFIFKVNSHKELTHTSKCKGAKPIEPDYYLSENGEKRRYFTVDSMAKLLTKFTVITIVEDDFTYHGKTKYSIEGVAQKV